MMNPVVSDYPLGFVIVISPGVQVAVEAREITAGNLKPNTMTRPEIVAGRFHVDDYRIDPTILHPYLLVPTVAVASAQNTFLNVVGLAVRIYVYELCGKVGIARRGGDI